MTKKMDVVNTKPQVADLFLKEMRRKGFKVTRRQAWEIFKSAHSCVFELAKRENESVTLAGIGTWWTVHSKRAENKGKLDVLRMRFRPSSRVTEVLNSRGTFLVPELTIHEVEDELERAVESKPLEIKKKGRTGHPGDLIKKTKKRRSDDIDSLINDLLDEDEGILEEEIF